MTVASEVRDRLRQLDENEIDLTLELGDNAAEIESRQVRIAVILDELHAIRRERAELILDIAERAS